MSNMWYSNCIEVLCLNDRNRWDEMIEEYDKIKSPIARNLLYKVFPKYFAECDRSKKAKEFYKRTDQPSNGNYDTMTSWISFACSYLGFRNAENMADSYFQEYKGNIEKLFSEKEWKNRDHDWVDEQLKTNCNNQDAFDEFLRFSEMVYTVGNLIPVGYNPRPRGLNDRWDIKMKWIQDTFFDEKGDLKEIFSFMKDREEKNLSDNEKEAWKEFFAKINNTADDNTGSLWDRYINVYHLNTYIENGKVCRFNDDPNGIVTPRSIKTWSDFFRNVTNCINNRIESFKPALEHIASEIDN